MSNRAIDRHEEAICEVLARMDWEDETFEQALDFVAPVWSLSRERLESLVRTWCAIGGFSDVLPAY